MKILLVEDNPGDVQLLTLALNHAALDCELAVMQDGGEALAFVQAGNAASIDLAIVDLNLPKNDGLEILAALRGKPAFANVPVIVFTSSASPKDRARMEVFRIAQFLSKPNNLDDYLRIGATIKDILHRGST